MGRSAIVPEFLGHSGYDTIEAAIVLSERKINHNEQIQAISEGGGTQSYFWRQKSCSNCALALCDGLSPDTGYVIVPDVFGGLAPSDVAKAANSNAG